MKKLLFTIMCICLILPALPAAGAQFELHGDMNNRFLIYTNHNDWFQNEQKGTISDDTVSATYGELKYRFWFEAADDEDDLKGVYAIEVGGIRFGREGSGKSQGGSFSGDGVNVETRWAYLDFQTPGVEQKARWRMGLRPWKISPFLWQETATGVDFTGTAGNMGSYQLGWTRSIDKLAATSEDKDRQDVDSYSGRLDLMPMDDFDLGLFALYTVGDNDPDDPDDFADVDGRGWLLKSFASDAKLNIWSLGVDGSFSTGPFSVFWDLVYQGGEIDDITFDDSEFSGESSSGDFDLSAYLLHLALGYKMGNTTFKYTFWYASGDDDASDNDFNGYLAYDLDRDDNLTLFEGVYSDDATYFTERPYILDKGFIMNKLAVDHKMSEKLTIGGAVMYMLTSEDIEYTDSNGKGQENSDIGFEINGWAKYMLYKRLELAVNAGYLFSGDAMDAFETGNLKDGSADEDIFVSSFRVRYRF